MLWYYWQIFFLIYIFGAMPRELDVQIGTANTKTAGVQENMSSYLYIGNI